MRGERKPDDLVDGKRIGTSRCRIKGEALAHVYDTPAGNVVVIRCRMVYKGTPGAWVLDQHNFATAWPWIWADSESLERPPNHLRVRLDEWDGSNLPILECEHDSRPVDWEAVGALRVTAL